MAGKTIDTPTYKEETSHFSAHSFTSASAWLLYPAAAFELVGEQSMRAGNKRVREIASLKGNKMELEKERKLPVSIFSPNVQPQQLTIHAIPLNISTVS